MSISIYLSAVNQKLLYARRLLRLAKQSNSLDKHAEAAIAQSVGVQLQQAWHWHIMDIAASYETPDPQRAVDAESLVKILAEAGKSPGEGNELLTLETDTGSWLHNMLAAVSSLARVPEIRKALMDADRLPVISVDAEDSTPEWSVDQARIWIERFQELVDRQREVMLEF